MMDAEEVQKIVARTFPAAEITVMDMTGTQDHFEVTVLWEGFRGKSLIQQHKMVHEALAGALEDGRIHAVKIKTFAPK